MTDPAREALVARLRPLTAGWPEDLLDPRRPAFLSRSRAGGVTWYAVAHSPRQAREVREYLLAFVGPSHADFAGQAAEWNRGDPVEAELAAGFPHSFRLSPRAGDAEVVAKLFARLRQMLRERPVRERADPPPLGRLLRDFELLLRAADWPAAAALLDRLRDRGQLTADQLSGLNLRLLAGQGRWAEVLSAPELPALTAGRMPVAVAEVVAAAVFHEHLARFTNGSDAAAHFREQVSPAFGLVFRHRAAWRHPDAVKAAAIADAASRASIPEPAEPPRDTFATAVEAHTAGDAASAFSLLAPGPFTPESLRLLVEVALDVGEIDAARTALAAVRDCPPPIRDKAFARRASKALLDELEEVAGTADARPPSDWLGWLARAADGSLPGAAEAAARLAAQWPRPDAGAFNAALAEHIGGVFPAVRDALPTVLEVLIPGGIPDARFAPSYRLLLERMVLDDDLSPATAPAVAELAAAVLRAAPVANPTRNDYKDVTEALLAAWHHLRQPAMLDWGLGVLDLAAEHAIHRHADVTRLAQDVAAEFARAPRLVTPGQRALLRTICGELDAPAAGELLVVPTDTGATPVDEAAGMRKKLGRRRVVLLTLSDRIAALFRQLMREHYPDARADVVQEYDGNDRLQDAAGSADVFIVNTFDAKHAATLAVPKSRPTSAPTLYPKGKNAARQLDALEEWLRSLA